jgi:glycosyltransferase involved in cell wall biosynthesis
MKVLHLNAADIEGGAARAANNLLHGLTNLGVDARLHVQRKNGTSPQVEGPRSMYERAMSRVRPTIEQLIFGITPGKVNGPFSAAFLPDGVETRVSDATPDIIHLHWVARMMRLETLRHFTVPIIWTMHDSWAFTGGCYLPGDCTRYRESCGKCPVLISDRENDLSNRIWQRKQKAWNGLNLTIIAPSRWMAACAQASSLFRNSRIEVIPNGLDVNRFKSHNRRSARDILSLPQEKKLILFGAKGATSDRNKGFHLLAEALRTLAAHSTPRDSIELIIFGSTEPDTPPDLGFKTHYLGWQYDDTNLANLYAAADVFVLPSLHESLGYTVMEAMACGTPCVAFNQGGVPDLIDHLQNGYLANPYEPTDLAHGISWILENEERWNELGKRAQHKIIESFAVEKIAEKHLALYFDILRS